MINYKQKVFDFIKSKKISLRGTAKRLGMSASQLINLKNHGNMYLTINLLTRFIDEFKKDGICEYIFSDNEELAAAMEDPNTKSVLTNDDVRAFLLAVKSYVETGNACQPLRVILDSFITYTGFSAGSTPEKFADGPHDIILCLFLLSCIDLNATDYFGASVVPVYPDTDYREWAKYLLETGSAATWTDIAYLLRKAREEKSLSLEEVNTKLGLSASCCIRIEKVKAEVYRVDDIVKIDNFFGFNGQFLALCIHAAKINMILAKIVDDTVSDQENVDETYRHALTSFVCLLRNIEVRWGNEETGQLIERLRRSQVV